MKARSDQASTRQAKTRGDLSTSIWIAVASHGSARARYRAQATARRFSPQAAGEHARDTTASVSTTTLLDMRRSRRAEMADGMRRLAGITSEMKEVAASTSIEPGCMQTA